MRLIKFKRAIAYSGTLVAVLVVLLTSYLVGGRILISIFSRDTSFFEERIVEYTGVPVSVDSLTGSFDGLNPKSFDGNGNYAFGIKEHLIFPEINYESVSEIWGMDIIINTTAKNDDEALALLQSFNFPIKKR